MKATTNTTVIEDRLKCKPANRHSVCLIMCLVILFLLFGVIQAEAKWPQVVPSKDGIPISFEVYGAGEPSLVFVGKSGKLGYQVISQRSSKNLCVADES
jgi:hypothetical protein